MPELHVISTGPARVTDLGRPAAHLGFSNHGALDEGAARSANALVGNADEAPLIEAMGVGIALRPTLDQVIAVTGAHAHLFVAGRPAPMWSAQHVRPGDLVEVRSIGPGLRIYVSVLGSLEAARALGSCAPDPVLQVGEQVVPGRSLRLLAHVRPRRSDFGSPLLRLNAAAPHRPRTVEIEVTPGPDAGAFGRDLALLYGRPFTMSHLSDAVGLRFAGPIPRAERGTELVSAGVPIGALEVPGGDHIIVLHRGRGVTAGYPVPAVVTRHGLDRLAQLRPGECVHFTHGSVSTSVARYRRARREIEHLRSRARTVLHRQFEIRAATAGGTDWFAAPAPAVKCITHDLPCTT